MQYHHLANRVLFVSKVVKSPLPFPVKGFQREGVFMNRKLLSVLLGLGLAAVLGACAEEPKPPEKAPEAPKTEQKAPKAGESPKAGGSMAPSPKASGSMSPSPSAAPAKKP